MLSNLFYRKKVYKKYVYMLFVASNASDWWMTTFTPSSSDQMIRNLSMKIGEVDSGSARLLCAASNLAEPESTSPIFMLKFLIIWSAAITRLEVD